MKQFEAFKRLQDLLALNAGHVDGLDPEDIAPSYRAAYEGGIAAAERLIETFDEKTPVPDDVDLEAFLALGPRRGPFA